MGRIASSGENSSLQRTASVIFTSTKLNYKSDSINKVVIVIFISGKAPAGENSFLAGKDCFRNLPPES